ncbi:hypothetical protein SCA6_018435 [Theobroma cacao]
MDQLYKIKSKWYAFVVASTFSSKVNHVKCKNAVILIRLAFHDLLQEINMDTLEYIKLEYNMMTYLGSKKQSKIPE